jgi:ribosomal protein S12 methylthiotransferase
MTSVRGRAAFVVLGCAKNQVEAEAMSSRLAGLGWELTADIPNASVLVVHTCGFLQAARDEALKTVADLRRAAPRSFLVMTGCFAQYLGPKQCPPGVDALLGTGDFHLLPDVLQARFSRPGPVRARSLRTAPPSPNVVPIKAASPGGYHDAAAPRPLRHGQASAYVRISEGCNHRCTFCIIPQLRGNLKSRAPDEIYAEARGLVDRGIGEIVLISQDTTDYGRDLAAGTRVTDLIQRMRRWKDLRWLRLLYCYPSEVDDALIRLLAEEEKLCGYLDMPLQHISDPVLKAMARDAGEKETRALLERLRRRVPNLTLRTTFIVGFPGETDQDFRKMLDLVESEMFDHVGVFPYSLENRSPSARFAEPVPAPVVEERWETLLAAQTRVLEKKNKARVGRTLDVLVESDPAGGWCVRAAHQAPEVDGQVALSTEPPGPGFYKARITGFRGVDLTAELAQARVRELVSR